jgi:pyruvate,water dikinase
MEAAAHVRWLEDVSREDVPSVGGKNASLGEMIRNLRSEGIRVPGGFATTAAAYRAFLAANDLGPRIRELLAELEVRHEESLAPTGAAVRALFAAARWPAPVERAIREAYAELARRTGTDAPDVAVRSSATAEDLPEASFAGQQDSYLDVSGADAVLEACRRCYASLFTDRAIAYRERRGFDHMRVALSVGVQRMVHADRGGAGVLFTLDPETGFPDVVTIDAAWGLGESVVQGLVDPDRYLVFKPLLDRPDCTPILEKALGSKATKVVAGADGRGTRTVETTAKERAAFVLPDEEILQLARWGRAIERHYGRPMDVEWARAEDGLHVVQARPETVQSRRRSTALSTYRLLGEGRRLLEGVAIGQAVAAGKVCVLLDAKEIERFEDDDILVTGATDPDWVPIMKRARGIVTDHGGRTSHAAIVSRELGLPAVVGTETATRVLAPGQEVTLSCAEGDRGVVYEGLLPFEREEVDLTDLPRTRTRIMMNVASPAASFRWWRLPVRGIGLARMEFIIGSRIRIHPMALARFDDLRDEEARRQIESLTAGYGDKREYFVGRLARGIARIAAAQYPEPVIVRTSDFKTNEYANLVGGREFEPVEANPMLGWRGASRYCAEGYREGFALECRALRRVRSEIGLDNVIVMIPFCRTLEEADRVLEEMARHGLRRGEDGLQVYVMAEIPANVVLADGFAERFDGFSIGTNDLTQLVLGVDRDSERLAHLFDERNEAVRRMVRDLVERAHAAGRPVGICGQAPSDHPDFAEFLVEVGIDSMSLNPDSVVPVLRRVAAAEARTADQPQPAAGSRSAPGR